jgi:DNA-directed RNA polymerase specialized sigma24 family protein
VSLDAPAGDSGRLADVVASDAPEEAFDRDWIRLIISLALEALEWRQPRLHQVLKLRFEERLSYADIARNLGLDAKQVDNQIQQARAKLGELIRAEVAAYCGTREEYDDEIACLKRFMAPSRAPADPA